MPETLSGGPTAPDFPFPSPLGTTSLEPGPEEPGAAPPPPSGVAVPSKSPLKVIPEATWFEGNGGVKLHEVRWRPEGVPRACLVLVHGLKDHSARYDELANALARIGVVTQAADLRGHGKSEGERVWVNTFDEYVADLEIAVRRARADYPETPVFLFGHSMGGTIVTLYAITRRPDLRGLIVSAGSLKPNPSLTLTKVIAAKELSVFSPRALSLELDDELFSRDPAVVAGMATDPLVEKGIGPARTAGELIAARERLQAREGEVRAPLLVLHGSADKVCNPEGSRELVQFAGSVDKTLIIYDGFYHDLLHEPDHSAVLADIVRWIDARAAPRKAALDE